MLTQLRHPATLKLVNGADVITVRPLTPKGSDPVICKTWDLGAPETRYTSVPNPGADGITYSTGFLGARTVTLELALLGGTSPDDLAVHDAYWYANKLTNMTHPTANPVLHITRGDETTNGQTYTMDLRGSPYNLPFLNRSAALLELQLVFTCPLGLLQSQWRQAGPIGPTPQSGLYEWVFPAKFDKTFGLYNARFPKVSLTLVSDTVIAPVIYIHGPVTDPLIIDDSQQKFTFDGLTLQTGETLQIDMDAGTLRIASGAGTVYDDMTAYNKVDWAVSTFWRWAPGTRTVTFVAASGTMTIQYRDRRIMI